MLNRAFGIIPVAIQVRDTASSTSEYTHTFVGWQRSKQYEPVRLAVVAPVTLSPSAALFDTDPATRLAAWKAELDPGSRINRILDGTDVEGPAGPVPVTWAVDRAVLGTDASASAGNPDRRHPEATRSSRSSPRWSPGSRPRRAGTPSGPSPRPTPTSPRPSSPVRATRRSPPKCSERRPRPGARGRHHHGHRVAGGRQFRGPREAGLRQAYASTGLQAVVGSSSALPATRGFTGQAPRRTGSGMTLLAWDDVLSRLSTQATTPAEGALTTQRLVAETAAILSESPGVARSFLMAMPRTLNPDVGALRQVLGTLAQTPWVQLVTTAELQQQAAAQDPVASTAKGSWDGTATRRSTPPG